MRNENKLEIGFIEAIFHRINSEQYYYCKGILNVTKFVGVFFLNFKRFIIISFPYFRIYSFGSGFSTSKIQSVQYKTANNVCSLN